MGNEISEISIKMILKRLLKYTVPHRCGTNYTNGATDNCAGQVKDAACYLSPVTKNKIMTYHDYKNCIEACLECAALCNHCASSCLKEKDVKMMAHCIQLDMECAAMCYYTAQMMSLGSRRSEELCSMCAQICRECADECETHDNEHCKECAKACRKCAEECMEVTEVF